MFFKKLLLISMLLSSFIFFPLAVQAGTEKSIKCGTFVFNNLYEPAMKEGEKPKGFFADVMNEVTTRLGMRVSFAEVASFATAYEELKSGKYDMLCASFGSYAANYDKMLFSDVLFYDPLFPYGDFKKNYSEIKNKEDINQEKWRIAGMDGELGGYFGPIVFPKATMHFLPQSASAGDLMNEVFSNKADIILITKAGADAYQKANPDTLKKLTEKPIAMFPVRFVFKPDDVHSKTIFDQVIEDMKAEGRIEEIKLKNGIN